MSTVIVFDLFHTLVSPEDVWPSGFNRERSAAAALGLDPHRLAEFWDGPGRDRYSGRRVAELLREAAADQGREVADEMIARAVAIYGRYHDRALMSPRPEVVQGLAALEAAGCRLALLSNADDREVAAWPQSPLAQLIPTACFSFQLGLAKPDPAAYTAVLAPVAGVPSSAVFVGDGGSDEFEGARRAGIGTIVCVDGFGTPSGLRPHRVIREASASADVVVSSVAEIPRLLQVHTRSVTTAPSGATPGGGGR